MSANTEREEALRIDPEVLAVRRSAAMVAGSTFARLYGPLLEAEPLPEPAPDDRDGQAVRRMALAAAGDDGYRRQLVELAALHGALFREAVDAVYEIEVRTLGRFEAEARHHLDLRHLAETRRRDAQD